MRAVRLLGAQGEKAVESTKRYRIAPIIEELWVEPRFDDGAFGASPERTEHSVNFLGSAQVNKASPDWAMRVCNPAFGRSYRDKAPVFP
jgi:hypothetical protein